MGIKKGLCIGEKLKDLYTKIENCCNTEIVRRNHQLIKNVKQLLPDIMEFTNIILDKSNFEVDDEIYQVLYVQYMGIVEDLMNGIENQDEVLVMDSLYDGLLEFINIFWDDAE